MKTLTDLLVRQADARADQQLYAFLDADCAIREQFSYQQFLQRVCILGEQLKERNIKGERALLFYPTSADYVTAFFACLYAGVIAVPLYPPRKNRSVERIAMVIRDARPAVILSTQQIADDVRSQFLNTEQNSIAWITTDNISGELQHPWKPVSNTAEDIAFLQYTSGSTGQPKGVILTHGQLLANEEMLFRFGNNRTEPVVINWLPLYHDMGLIGNLLYTLYAGGSAYLMSPFDFLQQPFRWLKALSLYQGTYSGAPNFAYEECVKRITAEQLKQLDLHSWEVAFNGAEPVNAATLKRFEDTFAPAGFKRGVMAPCYGMAEATLVVSGIRPANGQTLYTADAALLEQHILQPPQNDTVQQIQLVNCGMPVGQEVVITDYMQGIPLPEERVGELWVKGPNVASGYWNNEAATTQAFKAFLPDGKGPYLRTGDLGFMKDGAIYITGRLKELIIIRGRNIYPQDVERLTCESHEMLERGATAAFGVTVNGEEQLVIVQELKRQFSVNADTDPAIQAIRSTVTAHFDIQPHAIILIRKGALLRTSSGKIQRNACRRAFLSEEILSVVTQWQESPPADMPVKVEKTTTTVPSLSYDTVIHQLKNTIARFAGISAGNISIHDPFEKLGLDSMGAVKVASALEQALGIPVTPTMIYDYPNIDALAAALLPTDMHGVHQQLGVDPASHDEPIAVVGIGCRLPGADGPDAYWELLRGGETAVRKIPAHRWHLTEQDENEVGDMITNGGFLEDVSVFDADFFGINEEEARKMDPQQRLLLEVSWQAFEHAGIVPESLAKQPVGVFVGISSVDYSRLQTDTNVLDSYFGTGNAGSIAANRLSYYYDFRGPSLAVDTACSSSLVAVHQACNSLQRHECNLALTAGVNVMSAPDLSIVFARAGMLAPDGRCKTFDASANGYVRGEGAGVVVLKRLSDAMRDGDTVYGVIKGTAVNQDGRSNGLTAPNGPAQEAVIRSALTVAGIHPNEVSFIEAHGTGTVLGDPIELNTLLKVYTEERLPDHPFYVGSVKTNIGHLEAAAGIAGLIKTLLCLHHRAVVPHLHLKTLNHNIQLPAEKCIIPSDYIEFKASKRPLLAGVSSFGFGGTNAHVLLEEGPVQHLSPDIFAGSHLVVLSAADHDTLTAQIRGLSGFITAHPHISIRDLAANLLHGRSQLSCSKAFIAGNLGELKEKLDEYLLSPEQTLPPSSKTPGKIAFLFTGQGAQYKQMGWQLYKEQSVFRESFDQCSALLEPLTGISLVKLLYEEQDNERIHHTAITQPLLVAFEISLTRLWESWGIVPQAVMGHSVGEIAAAHIAGVMSLENAMLLISIRGKLMQQLPPGGQMWAISATEENVMAVIKPFQQHISVASFNAPQQIVISGHADYLAKPLQIFADKGIRTVQLKVSHAFHSPLMQPAMDEFRNHISHIPLELPRIPLLSNITGEWAGQEICTPDYWVNHIIAPVRFLQSINTLASSFDICCEIGPHPVLTTLARQSPEAGKLLLLSSIINHSDNTSDMLRSLGSLYSAGCSIAKEQIYPLNSFRRLVLPAYPFKKTHYWIDQRAGAISVKTQALHINDILSLLQSRHLFTAQEQELMPDLLQKIQYTLYKDELVNNVREILYAKKWEAAAIQSVITPQGETGKWLVFTDQLSLIHELQQQHKFTDLHLVVPDALRSQVLAKHTTVHTFEQLNTEEYNVLVQQMSGGGTILFAFDMEDKDPLNDEQMYDQAMHLMQLLSAISRISFDRNILRFLLITPLVTSVQPGTSIFPAVAVLHGMLRSAQHELPDLSCRIVMTAAFPETDWKRILFNATDPETEVAYINGTRHVARLAPASLPAARPANNKLNEESCWLITGGNSSMIRNVMTWLMEQGVKHFLLTSRSAPITTNLERLEDIVRPVEGTLTWCVTDISTRDAVQVLKESLLSCGRPLEGILHLAGQLKDGPLFNMQWEDMTTVFAPKIKGTIHLHELSLEFQPKHFICFSSLAALVGSPYQSNYAAANAFMDAFADWRREQGYPAVSINWGPWEGTGMAKAASSHQVADAAVVNKTAAAINLSVLDFVLNNSLSHPAVIDFDKTVALQWLPHIPFFQYLREKWQTAGHQENAHASSLMERLQVSSLDALQNKLQEIILHELKEMPGLVLPATVPGDATFFALGMDSMMTVALHQRLQKKLQLNFSVAALYNYNTIARLAVFLSERNVPHPVNKGIQHLSPVHGKTGSVPIAIIGVGCRMPGGIEDAASFWDFLTGKGNAISVVKDGRWGNHKEDTKAGFVDNVDKFDNEFFNITPLEAVMMDPQQRLVLQTAWHALEDAGIPPDSLSGTHTGVFMGMGQHDYAFLTADLLGDNINAYYGQGNGHCFTAGRISHLLGLQGPSLAMDTACSSSLLAIQMACDSLRNGNCDLALAGGVQLMLSPLMSIYLSRTGALSGDGLCRTFSADADGFVRGEGTGIVVLKKLDAAIADGDRIIAVIKGGAINHDGKSSSITAPNGLAQQDLIRSALENAAMLPEQISFIEAHGTGTPLGDPIELDALHNVFKRAPGDTPLLIGALKSNIGHLEAAAGVAGIIKAAMALQYRLLPANLHFKTPNPHFGWAQTAMQVPVNNIPLTSSVKLAAGVSAFGLSGTNVHVILEEAPYQAIEAPVELTYQLVTVSAKDMDTLLLKIAGLHEHCIKYPDQALHDIAFTSNTGRQHFKYRTVCVVRDKQNLLDTLSSLTSVAAIEVYHQQLFSDITQLSNELLLKTAIQYISGETPEWKKIYEGCNYKKITLPLMPFRQQRFWLDMLPDQSGPAGNIQKHKPEWEQYLYDYTWIREKRQMNIGPLTRGKRIIFPDDQEEQRRWESLLPDAANTTLFIYYDKEWRHDGNVCLMHPADTTHWSNLCEVISAFASGERISVLYHSTDTQFREVSDALNPPDAALLHLNTLRLLVQSFTGAFPHFNLAVITTTIKNSWEQSAVIGWCKCLALESDKLLSGILELNDTLTAGEWDSVVTSFLSDSKETLVAYRSNEWWVPRIQALPAISTVMPLQLDPVGAYLVTGGTGYLGLKAVKWLVDNGARKIFVNSRGGNWGQEGLTLVDLMSERGITITILKADITRETEVIMLLEQVRLESGCQRISGVIHAAGISGRTPAELLTESELARMAAPKIAGTWWLYQHLKLDVPDFFIAFSSIAAAWGGREQAHYTAANQWMDALIQSWRYEGCKALSVRWGPWNGGGMTQDADVRSLESIGITAFPAWQDLTVLHTLIHSDCIAPLVVNADWSRLYELFETRHQGALFELLPIQKRTTSASTTNALRQQLNELPVTQATAMLQQLLKEEVAGILLFQQGRLPELQKGFFDLGMDSLTAVQLMEKINKQLGIPLKVTHIFEYGTIYKLTDYLLGLIRQERVVEKVLPAYKRDKRNSTHPVDILISQLASKVDILEQQEN